MSNQEVSWALVEPVTRPAIRKERLVMKKIRYQFLVVGALTLATLDGAASVAQDKDSVKVGNILGFSDFKGYEGWQVVAVSATPARNVVDVIVANPEMIAAYKSGVPGNGKPFPDGSKMAKIHWNGKVSEAPGHATVADTLHDVDFMIKDSKRFSASAGWGYAPFEYDAVEAKFTPGATDEKCGAACHTVAKSTDFVFTSYAKR